MRFSKGPSGWPAANAGGPSARILAARAGDTGFSGPKSVLVL